MQYKSYPITPVPKPRMTQSDKWKMRPAVLRYRDFCDQVRAAGIELPDYGAVITFVLPMPNSWSKKKRIAMHGKPHQQKPDLDNLLKALADAVHEDDSHIWNFGSVSKLWGNEGLIAISTVEVMRCEVV